MKSKGEDEESRGKERRKEASKKEKRKEMAVGKG